MGKMIIGITGANGFLGKNLKKYFLQKKISFNEFSGDLLNEKDVVAFFKESHVTHLIHLAGTFSSPFQKLVKKNCFTTEMILRVGKKYSLRKIIFASTGAVYGEPLHKKSSESDNLQPNTLYGYTKLLAEEVIINYAQNMDLSYMILRFPNIYGDGNDKGVIFNFITGIKNKKEITIYGEGNQKRNFLHVSDACRAIVKSLNYKKSEIFNISSKKNYSIHEIVKILAKRQSFSIKYENVNNQLHDLILDTKKAKKLLNFSAREDIKTFLKEIVS